MPHTKKDLESGLSPQIPGEELLSYIPEAAELCDIETVQPSIPVESYLGTYITALDLCLQGLISPSTLGIDVKKLDNAEAQREKEKATLYTRNSIIAALQSTLPALIDSIFKAYDTFYKRPVRDIADKVEIPFGEYANPSFESQVETCGKARQFGRGNHARRAVRRHPHR